MSDLLQHLTDLDPEPWNDLIHVTGADADREFPLARLPGDRRQPGMADLVLRVPDGPPVAIEVKVAHSFSDDQRHRYEASTSGPLFLAAMNADRETVDGYERWRFLRLAEVFDAWRESDSVEAATMAAAVVPILETWDDVVDGVFRPHGAIPLDSVEQKFLARLVSRGMVHRLRRDGIMAWAGVSSGSSGLALVQAYGALNGDRNRCLMAEVRWLEGLDRADFRLGVDFDMEETAQTRAEVWELAQQMSEAIRIDAYRDHLAQHGDGRSSLFPGGEVSGRRGVISPETWSPVVERGFRTRDNPGGVVGGRRAFPPGFAGDGAQRFQAVGKIDLSQVDANDLIDLIGEGLRHLCAHVPRGYRCVAS